MHILYYAIMSLPLIASSAFQHYLSEFYQDPRGLEEFKVNFLKNHYFDLVKGQFIPELASTKTLLIGVTKRHPDLVYFRLRDLSSEPIIYNRRLERFVD